MRARLQRVSICLGVAALLWAPFGCSTPSSVTGPEPEKATRAAETGPAAAEESVEVSVATPKATVDAGEEEVAETAVRSDVPVFIPRSVDKIREIEASLKPLQTLSSPPAFRSF